MSVFDMPRGYVGFLFVGKDSVVYFAEFVQGAKAYWNVRELDHLSLGRWIVCRGGGE